MKKNGAQYYPEPERLWIGFFKINVEKCVWNETNEIGLHADIIIRILHAVKKSEKGTEFGKVLSEHGRYR